MAAIDGIGHGRSAAAAAEIASSVLEAHPSYPLAELVRECHDALRNTRGVVMSVATIFPQSGTLTWLGVGNVQAALQRAGSPIGAVQEVLLLRGGVVGGDLPPLQAASVSISPGDTLAFATDGIRGDFLSALSSFEDPQKSADRILDLYCRGDDDALVLIARLAGSLR